MRNLDLGDIATNIVRTPLATLTEGSDLATRAPYIAAVAGLLLLLFSMQGVSAHLLYLDTFSY
jgi:hypothetical protein